MENSHFQLQLPLGTLQGDLQRAVDLVGFGLQASEHGTVANLEIPNVFGQVAPAQDHILDVDTARIAFRSWIIANGLRDCVEAIGPALEWARKFCFMWTRPGNTTPIEGGNFRLEASLSGADWNTHIVGGARKFDRLTLPDKLKHLNETYGWTIPSMAEHVLSLNAARNCLAHRGGIVATADLKTADDPGLKILLRKLQIKAIGPSGERIVTEGSVVNADEAVNVSFVNREKQVLIGERVAFDTEEFVDAALTFLLFAMEIRASVVAVQNARRPQQADASSPSTQSDTEAS
jgi:hypothetical protein